MNQNVRKLTDGAMMCAIIGVLLLFDRQLSGMISFTFTFLLPLPMVFYTVKYGLKDSWIVFAGIVLLSMMLGTPELIFYMISQSLVGMYYGEGTRKQTSTKKLVLVTMLISVLLNVGSTLILGKVLGYDFLAEVSEMQTIFERISSNANVALPPENQLKQMLISILLFSTLLTGILQGYLVHIFSRLLLKRFRITVAPIQPVGLYFPPVWTGYVGIVGFVGLFYLLRYPVQDEKTQIILLTLAIMMAMYLVAFGVVYLLLLFAIRYPKRKMLNVLITLLCIFFAWPVLALAGFLYITTSIHQKILMGGKYATKDE